MSATGAVLYVTRSVTVRRRASVCAELARALKGALCEKHTQWGRTGCGALCKDHSKCHQRPGSQRRNIFTMAEMSTATHFEPSKEIPEVVKGSNYSISFVSVICGYLTKKAVSFFLELPLDILAFVQYLAKVWRGPMTGDPGGH